MPLFEDHKNFTVPAGAGSYAPERIQFNSQSTGRASPPMLGVTVSVEAAPATSTYELWLLSLGTDPTNDSNYFFYDFASAGKTWALASYRGAQLRAKSGGTSGTMTLSASAD